MRQKRRLDKWYEENKERLLQQGGILFFAIDKNDLFSLELLEELEAMGDHETIIQNINRYISDKGMAENAKR